MAIYNLKIEADDNQMTLYAIAKGWQATIPDKSHALEIQTALDRGDKNVDTVVRMIENGEKAEVFARRKMQEVVIQDVDNVYVDYYTKRSNTRLAKVLERVRANLENKVSFN